MPVKRAPGALPNPLGAAARGAEVRHYVPSSEGRPKASISSTRDVAVCLGCVLACSELIEASQTLRSIWTLVELPVLCCETCDEKQRNMLLHLIAKKFTKPIFTNYAVRVTDRNMGTKLERKPLSRKVLKL